MTQPALRGRGMGAYAEDGAGRQPFEPNLIDFRHSVVQAHKRADADDDTLEICAHCMCEVDLDPQPHRPGCPGIGKSRTSTGPVLAGLDLTSSPAARRPVVAGAAFRDDGLDALERMDAGLPQQPDVDDDQDDELEPDEEVLEEREPQVPVEPTSAPSAIEPPAAPSRSSSTDARSGPATWSRKRKTPEEAIAAMQRFVRDHGRAPARGELTREYVSHMAVARLFGGYAEGLAAAGLEPPTEQGLGLTREQGGRRWVKDDVVAAIKAFAETHGRVPTSEDREGLPGTYTVRRLFGNWSSAVEAAGFPKPIKGHARSSDAVKDSSSEGAATASSARGHARPVDERGLDDEQPAIRAPKPAATADGSGEPERAPAPDPVDERALAERGSERLGPDNPRSAGARDLTAVRTATLHAVNAIFDLLEQVEVIARV